MLFYIMRWENETTKRPIALDLVFSKEIVFNAYRDGFINWNVYMKAMEKINVSMNGSWLFDRNGFEKNILFDFN